MYKYISTCGSHTSSNYPRKALSYVRYVLRAGYKCLRSNNGEGRTLPFQLLYTQYNSPNAHKVDQALIHAHIYS